MKVKTDDTDASISCSVAIYQNLLVACYRGMGLLVSSYMYCLASYHAVVDLVSTLTKYLSRSVSEYLSTFLWLFLLLDFTLLKPWQMAG